MTVQTYDTEIRELAHFTNEAGRSYIIINQTYWYSADNYTDETAAAAYLKMHDLKGEENQKATFVRGELSALLRKTDSDIIQAVYALHTNGEEFVNVYYRNGACKKICVTADSLAALTRDVMWKI